MAFGLEIIEIGVGETLVGVMEAKPVLARGQLRLACGQHGESEKKQNLAIIHSRGPAASTPTVDPNCSTLKYY